jgi:hypothetical protein
MTQPNGQSESLAGSPNPLKSSGSLDQYSKIDSTPTIGVEFGRGIQAGTFPIIYIYCIPERRRDGDANSLRLLTLVPIFLEHALFSYLRG